MVAQEQNKKTIEQAINELDYAVSLLSLPRKDHQALLESLGIIANFVKEHKEKELVVNTAKESVVAE